VITIGEHASRAPDHSMPIDGTSEPRADRHHPATERVTVARLDYEMRVIPLQ